MQHYLEQLLELFIHLQKLEVILTSNIFFLNVFKIVFFFTDIVDKTASFVARNGPEFEARIRQNELGNPKFNFLNGGDPYHAYYHHKVKEFRDGKCKIFFWFCLQIFLNYLISCF